MATLIQYLEELADTARSITIPAGEVDRLAKRFGDRVRRMGRWNAGGDGSLEIPMTVIREAGHQIGNRMLAEAVDDLKAEPFTKALDASAAVSLIEAVAEAYRRYFRDLMTRYQSTSDSAESTRLRDQLVREIFGE